MGVPDKRYLYVVLYGAFIAQLAGVLLLWRPTTHIILLALLYLINAQVVFFTWGMNKTNLPGKKQRKAEKEQVENKYSVQPVRKAGKDIKIFFYTGLVMIIIAISLLIFKNNLQGYVIQFTALGLSILLVIQWNNNAKLYSLIKKKTILAFVVIVIILTAISVWFVLVPSFTLDMRFKVLALLCFLSSVVLLLNYYYAIHLIKIHSVPV